MVPVGCACVWRCSSRFWAWSDYTTTQVGPLMSNLVLLSVM